MKFGVSRSGKMAMETQGLLPRMSPIVMKICKSGNHKFLSRDKYATCERCRQARRIRRAQRMNNRGGKDEERWIVQDEHRLEELLTSLQGQSGYNFVLRFRRKVGGEGFYRIYRCPRWNKSKLPPENLDEGMDAQEKMMRAEQRRLSIHPNHRHLADKEVVGIGCPFSLVVKKKDNEPILVAIRKRHSDKCSPLKNTYENQLADSVYQWVANLLRLGHSASRIFECASGSTQALPGVEPCPKPPDDGPKTQIWEPTYKHIKNVEHRLRRLKREPSLHSDEKTSLWNLLQEWSGLSPGIGGHDLHTAQNNHVISWQQSECCCPPNKRTGCQYYNKAAPGCQPFFLVLQSPWQRKFMANEISAGRGHVLCLGETSEATSSRWVLQSLLMIDGSNAGVPIGFALGSKDNTLVTTVLLDSLAKTAPLGYKPRILMVDNSISHIQGIIESTWNKVVVRVCYFDIIRSWDSWLGKRENKIPSTEVKKKIMLLASSIKHSSSHVEANQLWQSMAEYLHKETIAHVSAHFYNEYIAKMSPAGPLATLWVNSLRKPVDVNGLSPESNLQSKKLFATLKNQFLSEKASKCVEVLVRCLVLEAGPFFASKCLPGYSSFDTGFGRHEFSLTDTQCDLITILDSTMGIGILHSSSNEAHFYYVCLKPPSCTCLDAEEALCKHVRSLAQVLGGLEKWDLEALCHQINTSTGATLSHPSTMGAPASVEIDDSMQLPGPSFLPRDEPYVDVDAECSHDIGFTADFEGSPDADFNMGTEPGPDVELCAAWRRLCSDRSITSEVLQDISRIVSRSKQHHDTSHLDILRACVDLCSRCVKGAQITPTLDEFQKILQDNLNGFQHQMCLPH